MKRLEKPRYRRAFVASNVGVQIAAQLHALRTSRNLSQEKLAEEIDMNQARISLMEKPDYQNYNVKTLKRFAEFYDVALDVRFVPIRDHVYRIINQSPKDMAPEPFEEKFEVPPPAIPNPQPSLEVRSAQPQKPQKEDP
jgi:transcriptional regulator with XRE-family HTH domain